MVKHQKSEHGNSLMQVVILMLCLMLSLLHIMEHRAEVLILSFTLT